MRNEIKKYRSSLLQSSLKRLPWLFALFFMGLLVSGAVGIFDDVVSKIPLIVSFQSLILGMAGNVGTQSLAVTIRRLAREKASYQNKLGLVIRETRISLIVGIFIAAVSLVSVSSYLVLFKKAPIKLSFGIAGCTAISLLISMILSGIFGTCVPLIFQKFKIDPALASGPIITTINDLVAVMTYYGLADILLIRLLKL